MHSIRVPVSAWWRKPHSLLPGFGPWWSIYGRVFPRLRFVLWIPSANPPSSDKTQPRRWQNNRTSFWWSEGRTATTHMSSRDRAGGFAGGCIMSRDQTTSTRSGCQKRVRLVSRLARPRPTISSMPWRPGCESWLDPANRFPRHRLALGQARLDAWPSRTNHPRRFLPCQRN